MRRLMLLAAASAMLAFGVGSSIARAAEGPGHGGEGGKGKPGGEEGAHANPNSAAHGDAHQGHRTPPGEIPKEGGVSIFGGTEHRPDGWRYRYDHGDWWYWSPSKHWMYYDGSQWYDYAEDNSTVEIPVQSDPNYYWYHDQWWYWMGNHWSFYDHDHWHDGAPGMGPTRRDEHHGEPKRDEHGPRRDEHEGSKK